MKYEVNGMTCGGCATSVTKAIKAIAPGAEVEVDLGANSVKVDGFDDAKAIENAVEDAGFDFGGPC
jgi:copper chaperone